MADRIMDSDYGCPDLDPSNSGGLEDSSLLDGSELVRSHTSEEKGAHSTATNQGDLICFDQDEKTKGMFESK